MSYLNKQKTANIRLIIKCFDCRSPVFMCAKLAKQQNNAAHDPSFICTWTPPCECKQKAWTVIHGESRHRQLP